MESFGAVLHDILIRKPTYSISAFAKDIGISAGLLNHIFNGKRTLTTEKFMLTVKNRTFDSEEIRRLKDAFFYDRYGESGYMKIKCFHELLQNIDFSDDVILPEVKKDFAQETTVLNDEKQIISALLCLFEDAEKCIYSNIDHANDKVNSILYALKKRYSQKSLARIVTNLDTNFSPSCMVALFSVIRFASIGVPTVTMGAEDSFSPDNATLFPYFIISDKGMILFDENYSRGICVLSEMFVKEKYRETTRKYNNCEKIVTVFDNEMEMSAYLLANESEETHTLQFTPSFLAHEDINYLVGALSSKLIFKDEIIMLLGRRYANKKWNVYTSIEGLSEFLDSGRSYVTSESYISRFSTEEKIRYLETLLDTMEEGKECKHNFYNIRFRFSDFAKTLSFQLDDNKLSIYSMASPKSEKSFIGQIAVFIGNNDISRVVSTYIKDYLPVCGEIISKSAACNCITSMLVDCRCRFEQD